MLREQLLAERAAHEVTARDAQQLKIQAHLSREHEKEKEKEREKNRYGNVSDGQSSQDRERESRGEEPGQQNLSLSGISTPTAVMPWRTEENKKRVSSSAPRQTEKSRAELEVERHEAHLRRALEEEHTGMQMELMRSGKALESLQQLLKDRDRTSARKERLFLSEKEMLVSEAEQATRAFQSAKEEVLYLLRERDHTARSLDEFSRQLCDMAGDGDETDLSASPLSVHRSPRDLFSSRHATPSAEGKSSGMLCSSSSSSSSRSSGGDVDEPLTSFRSKAGVGVGSGVGVSMHRAGWSSMNRIDSTEEQRKVKRGEGAIELDGMILSMQSVVNDRKRVRRLCRQKNLQIGRCWNAGTILGCLQASCLQRQCARRQPGRAKRMRAKPSSVGTVQRQLGSSLLLSLVMLVVITLLVVSAVRMSNSNLKTVGNMQSKNEAVAAAQQAIEQQVMANVSNFYTPVDQPISINGYTGTVSAPVCIKKVPVSGYSVDFSASVPNDTYWDIKAVVTNSRTGASATVHQGAKVRLDSTITC